MEATSFVSPRAVPQLADAEKVIAGVDRDNDTVLSALVPNKRGALRAAEARVDEMVVFASASESHNRTNVNRSIEESLRGFADVALVANEAGIPVHGAIACAFGCPFEGNVAIEQVAMMARRYQQLGFTGVSFGDTTGMAASRRVMGPKSMAVAMVEDTSRAVACMNQRELAQAQTVPSTMQRRSPRSTFKQQLKRTSGAGLVQWTDRFLADGHHVIGMDNLITGSLDNIAHLESEPRFDFAEHDVTEFIDVTGDLDGVLHFASPASPVDYLELPIQTLKVGSLGTHNALGLSLAKGARFLLASTSEVYGDPLVHPQPETYWGNVNPIGPRGVYDEAKRFAEAMTTAYHRYHGVDTRIVRIFNTYGPRMRPGDGRVVSNFIVQALLGIGLTVYGDGSQSRSFCYFADEVEGILPAVRLDGCTSR